MTTAKVCPICQKPAQADHMPFCSARCHQVDLHRWLGEVYRVTTDDQSPADADSEDDENNPSNPLQ